MQTLEKHPSSHLGVFELDDWQLSILNLYLRFFPLSQSASIVKRITEALNGGPLQYDDIYMVAGDFTGLTQSQQQRQQYRKHRLDNGHIDRDVNLDEFGYNPIFDSNSTSFVADVARVGGHDIDDGLNVSPLERPANAKPSACNILCRDPLPLLVDPFREAMYKTKKPSELTSQVPSLLLLPKRSGSGAGGGLMSSDRLTGYANVIREGMCHMAIPRDWTWGGPASDHCPLWIECYQRANKCATPKAIMNGNGCDYYGIATARLGNGVAGLTLNGGLGRPPNGHQLKESVIVQANGDCDTSIKSSPTQVQ